MDIQRLILLFIFGFSLILLWEAWQKEQRPQSAPSVVSGQQSVPVPQGPAGKPAPGVAEPTSAAGTSAVRVPEASAPAARGEIIRVRTDLLSADINTLGGTLSRLELLQHKDSADPSKNFVLLGPEHHYEVQSGLAGESGPNHRTVWSADPGERLLDAGQDALEVRLSAPGRDGVSVEKIFRFRRNSYVIGVALEIRNQGQAPVTPFAYVQLTHDGKPPAGGNSVAETFGAQAFTGYSVYTAEKAFQKVHPSDIDKGKVDAQTRAEDGWLAFVQHYFVSALIVPEKQHREYTFDKRPDGTYLGRAVVPAGTIASGATGKVDMSLYAGPQEQRRLNDAAPGLDVVVDYGMLKILAWPLFWLLEKFHGLTGNWGAAIILLTVAVKLMFFPLSAASYRSMAKMKLVGPRLQKLREMYGNDRAKMNQAMMELYKTEKINPLGGCFPILVQIPVFIALYWVLLAAIELRHAPFILWIKDLAALDPYFVLPTLMSVTMIIQTRMNPKPPDPVQAKVMAIMPFIFSVFFFFFPAGLVLYWLVNNILSILQQWQIQRIFERDKPAHAKR